MVNLRSIPTVSHYLFAHKSANTNVFITKNILSVSLNIKMFIILRLYSPWCCVSVCVY